ncbi:PQQ-binding-like beta-propeller repeat protein [Streptomyces sp. SID9124]|uniref:outer membrane protein assembly factor BamB family protein n=1 Tax=Streptomyces sp. SID9124 TaxID=2706108 RepID=UPI0013DEDA3A|nr:PQQ-binding-like beta-propeller repeat protein [Streptomyces sp. SID9124]NED14373.1 PQQ-binding-like beta-propeller repeat protein [Streptomyces sp. SID9124]
MSAPSTEGTAASAPSYTVLTELRRSAAGVEYVARDADGATVTLVVPRPDLARSSAFRRGFRAEADLGVRAAGDWVVPVYEVLEDDRVVTAYRPSLTLGAAVTRFGPLRAHDLRILGAALAAALTRLHALVPVHQGLAPHTVHLASDGPLLAGFGPLAAATEVRAGGGEPRIVLGYLTPEQVAGHTPGPASDVFVLGLLLGYAATGTSPFRPAAPEALVEDEPDLDGVPESLRPLLSRCLDRAPEARPLPAEIVSALAPDGARDLLDRGWLPGPLMAELSRRAASVLALEPPAEGAAHEGSAPAGVTDEPAAPDVSVLPPTLADSGEPGGARSRTAGRPWRPTRRGFIGAGAGVLVGAAGGWAGARATGRTPRDAAPAASRARVAGTPPAALWHYKGAGQVDEPLVWDDSLAIVPMIGPTVALDLRTGKERWTKRLTSATPVPARDDLLVGLGLRGIVTFSAASGAVHRTDTRYNHSFVERFIRRIGTQVWFTFAVDEVTYLACYDVAESDEVWRARLPEGFTGVDDLNATDKAVFVRLTREGATSQSKHRAVFLSLDRRTGKARWQKSFGPLLETEPSWIPSTGVLYVQEEGLRAYDLESGEVRWKNTADGGMEVFSPRAMAGVGDTLYVVDSIRFLYGVDARDGRTLWRSKPPGNTILRDDSVQVAVTTGLPRSTPSTRTPLYCLDDLSVTARSLRDGSPLWTFDGVDAASGTGSEGRWRVSSSDRTAVFSRTFSSHVFALPIG